MSALSLPTVAAAGYRQCGNCLCANASPPAEGSLLDAPEHVLSTLEQDGSRRWLFPRLRTGRWWQRRRIVAYVLIAIFVALPHLRIGGKPAVLLDFVAGKFILLGREFLPTDVFLVPLVLIAIVISIFLVTAISGRLWCGWGCPQTVYMEFVFRPLDRLFEGTTGKGGKPKRELTVPLRLLRWGIYLLLSMLLAHTFLAYFVGTDRLARWVQTPPSEHPAAFLLMAGTTAAMMFDFLFFREQMCLIACPYGRFQSVLLDRHSRIVGYDFRRGEPRGKGKRLPQAVAPSNLGDCVDCHQCVVVCPTGIDIRDGLQMECINCTQCIDACDEVMERVGLPTGLIRYTSQDQLDGKPGGWLRPRTILYPIVLGGVLGMFVWVLAGKQAFEVKVLPPSGESFYTRLDGGLLRNTLQIRLINRTDQPQQYSIEVLEPRGVELAIEDPRKLAIEGGSNQLLRVGFLFRAAITGPRGRAEAVIEIRDGAGNAITKTCSLRGPQQ